MTVPNDPDRVAEVRRALARLLDLLAREVVRQSTTNSNTKENPSTLPAAGADDAEDAREKHDQQ